MATPTEVSEQLDIPSATLRRYVSLFGEHLSEEAKRPRGRQFGEADVQVLSRIRSLLADGSSVDEVQAALGAAPLPPAETPPAQAPPEVAAPLPNPEPPVQTIVVTDEPEADAEEPGEEPDTWPRWRTFPKVQPVRTSREVRKMAAEMGVTDHLSQRLALAEDRIMTNNERMAVLEARIARLEEWVKTPWYRRIFSKPPEYDL